MTINLLLRCCPIKKISKDERRAKKKKRWEKGGAGKEVSVCGRGGGEK